MTISTRPSVRPRYDLSNDEIEALEEQLVARYRRFLAEAASTGSTAACLGIDGNDPLANLGRTLEQQVFDAEAGDHSVEVMHAEYDEFESRSLFFLVIDITSGKTLGCLRAITGTAGFGPMVKTMADCISIESYGDLGVPGFHEEIDLRTSLVPSDPGIGLIGRHRNPPGPGLNRDYLESYHRMTPGESIFDMATIVVPNSVRSGQHMLISLLAYACSWRAAELLQITHAVTFIRNDLLHAFRETLGMNWEDLAGLGETQYVPGDPFLSQPAYLHCDELRRMLTRERARQRVGRQPKAGPPFDRFLDLMAGEGASKIFLLS